MRFISLLPALLLLSCSLGDEGTAVYDRSGDRVGRVVVDHADRAAVYDRAGDLVGRVTVDEVYDEEATFVGRVARDGAIYDSSGEFRGRLSDPVRCSDETGEQVGSLGEDIDDEAAGGACLLLLFL